MAKKNEEVSSVPARQEGGGITKIRGEALPAYMEHGGPKLGFEQMGTKEKMLPRLAIVQSMSPIRKKSDPSYNADAQEGLFYNTLTGEVYGDEVYIVPLLFFTSAINMTGDGEIVCMSPDAVNCPKYGACKCETWREGETMEDRKPECSLLYNYPSFVLTKDNELLGIAVVSLKSTGIKVAKKWNGIMDFMGGDMFSTRWKVTSFATGDPEFYQWKFNPAGRSPEDIYTFAKQTFEGLKREGVKMDTRGLERDDEFGGREVNKEM